MSYTPVFHPLGHPLRALEIVRVYGSHDERHTMHKDGTHGWYLTLHPGTRAVVGTGVPLPPWPMTIPIISTSPEMACEQGVICQLANHEDEIEICIYNVSGQSITISSDTVVAYLALLTRLDLPTT